MTTIVYSCPFVPAEWIAAHGVRPMRILPHAIGGAQPVGAAIGVCPYARAFVNEVCSASGGDRLATGLTADAVVVTTTCDQMRRTAERIAAAGCLPVFLMHVPTTWQTVTAQKIYISELKRLGRFLVRLGGQAPAKGKLADVMREQDSARAALRAARGHLSARQFSEALADFHRTGRTDCQSVLPQTGCQPVPLALVGGPLLPQHFDIFDRIEAAGGQVVLDATESGERTLPAPFDRRALNDDPFLTLADAYFGSIPDAFRRPNTMLYTWLKRELAAHGVRGIIFRHYVWCDTWRAEAQRMKEWAGLPLLLIEAGDEETINGHAASRIQSFLEMLK